MWTRNTDTGKWTNQIDTLSKVNYDSLKQDLQSVKLFSKCLSGSTYLPINNLDNIYDVLSIDKIGFYNNTSNSIINRPLNGPRISLNASTSNEFYNKYLQENAFTLKNLFTPTKLINDQLNNYVYVDAITNGTVSNIGQVQVGLTIDGVRLIEGHRVLVKDQISLITLTSTTDPEYYFTNILPTANYYVVDNNITSITYHYYNQDNGIYIYTGNKLVRELDLSTYSDAYRYSVVAKLGTQNRDKEFHLLRLKNGYYPLVSENQNIEFALKHNWVLRNRVDYHNIFDINYYDILHHGSQNIYDDVTGITYSIPSRTIAVGDFGVIIDNQDNLTDNATFSISHIIDNKYKSNLKSITEVDKYYWICGDEGTLLKVSKIDFSIKKIELNETSNLTSISFYTNLYGMVVGKFNTIYWTNDGGDHWYKLTYPEFDLYSYNKVIQYDFNQAYVGGEAGVFIEFNYSGGSWVAYKRKISKELSAIDEYILVEDINDMYKTNWTTLDVSTYSTNQTSIDFGQSLIYTSKIIDNLNTLQISIDSQYFGNPSFSGSEYYICFSVSNSTGSIYNNPLYNQSTQSTASDIWNTGTSSFGTFSISLPLDSYGNLLNDTYTVQFSNYYNYFSGFTSSIDQFTLQTKNGKMLLISTNNDIVICYDIDSIITKNSNQFIYYGFSQSHSDVQTITRLIGTTSVYIGGDQIYKFSINDFYNIGNTSTNLASSNSYIVDNLYVNKIYPTTDTIYFAGNHSTLQSTDYISATFSDLDPTFNSRIKSKLLFLDYDIASKLNFFNSDGDYMLPNSATFSDKFTSITIGNYSNQYNWLSYYTDSQKTFEYLTTMENTSVVNFSSVFTFTQSSSFTFGSQSITSLSSDIEPFAPSIVSPTYSRFSGTITATNSTPSNYDVMMNKYMIIFKRNYRDNTEVGDVLYLSSSVIDCNLVVNRILTIGTSKYLYCFSEFNQNIINNLQSNGVITTVQNLNRFSNVNEFVSRFSLHPASIGYSITASNGLISVSANFNNKTAYYNMQSTITTDIESKNLIYDESFLNFGYSPTYNILDYLSVIDPVFSPSKKLSILPEYINLPGNNSNTFTHSNIYIDPTILPPYGATGGYTFSKWGTNQLAFGSDFKFHWESLLLNTFVDIIAYDNQTTYKTQRLLIIDKYYDSNLDGYIIKFHKNLNIDGGAAISRFDIKSRNTLQQVSDDLQILNNIQKTTTSKTTTGYYYQPNPQTFTNLENELRYKFPTDSYLKALVSDYDVRNYLSGIIYTDSNNQIALNILNLEKQITYNISSIVSGNGKTTYGSYTNKLLFYLSHNLKIGDLVLVGFGTASQSMNQYSGLQTVIDVSSNTITLSIDYNGVSYNGGSVTFIKKDPFFNYQPIDLFDLGIDKNVTRSVEIKPENFSLVGSTYSLINLDLTKYKFQFVDGLSLEEVNNSFSWLLEAEISDAVIGRDSSGPIWYSGTWKCGRWFGGTWVSGSWLGGDWYGGTWSSYNTTYKIISDQIDTTYIDNSLSKWYGGRWFDGTWNGGTWYNGRRYTGDWNGGNWYNGIWNDGHWYGGNFEGGVWVQGTWESGIFNCDSKPSYWIDGTFKSGDFENGMWYNGQFGNKDNILARFGTKSTNTKNSTWHSGSWISGEFHSYLNVDSQTGKPDISDIHKYSIWKTGNWFGGDFYGGVAYNVSFKSGYWHGGILEEIQVIGVSASSNTLQLNGVFRFNIGDEIWIIDDYTNGIYSPIGTNDNPMKYRVDKVTLDLNNKLTYLIVNYNLSSLNIPTSSTYSVETGLRVVSYYKDSHWGSGIWTNGIFDGGQFDSGIWYNGVFLSGNWGN